jgi:hypothetical protein
MRVLVLGTEKRPPEMIEADIKGEPRVEPEGPPEREEPEPRHERRERRGMGLGFDAMGAFDSEPAGRRDHGDR